MTFQRLIALHRRALRHPQPILIPVERRNRAPKRPCRPLYTDFASL